MLDIITALTPLFLIIALGYFLKQRKFPGDDFWPLADKFVYYICLPALLFHSLATASFEGKALFAPTMAIFLAVLLLMIGLIIARPLIPRSGPIFGSVFMGAVRWNAVYIALPAAIALFGEKSIILAGLAFAALIPIINVFCVYVLMHFACEKPLEWKKMVMQLLKNPFILSCVGGIGWNIASLPLPYVVVETIQFIGRPAITLGLLTVGAGLDFGALKLGRVMVLVSSILKFILLPLLTALLCIWLDVDNFSTNVMILFACVPTGIASYVLASQLGGDTKLMAAIIVVQTLAAAITMPLTLMLARIIFPY